MDVPGKWLSGSVVFARRPSKAGDSEFDGLGRPSYENRYLPPGSLHGHSKQSTAGRDVQSRRIVAGTKAAVGWQ